MEEFIKIYKKYLYGKITHEEFRKMRREVNRAKDETLFRAMEAEWKDSIGGETLERGQKENIREKLDFCIESDLKRKNRKRILRIAAVVIPFLLLGAFGLTKISLKKVPDNFTVSVERGSKAVVTLPDKSKVWINSDSKLEYKRGKHSTRVVKLSGEAFFKVFKNKSHPFIVRMNHLQVEVLGTSFNVNARKCSDLIETSLVEGSIKLSGTDLSQNYYLKPNEKAVFSKLSKKLQIVSTDNEVETAWKNNEIKFRSERLIDLFSRLENWYGIKIVCLCPEIENDLVSGTFRDEKLDVVMEVIKKQYNVNCIRNGDTIIIRSKKTPDRGCMKKISS